MLEAIEEEDLERQIEDDAEDEMEVDEACRYQLTRKYAEGYSDAWRKLVEVPCVRCDLRR